MQQKTMQYEKLICRKCGWYTFDFKLEVKRSIHYPYQKGGQCMGCGYVVVLMSDIPIVDSVDFEKGEG